MLSVHRKFFTQRKKPPEFRSLNGHPGTIKPTYLQSCQKEFYESKFMCCVGACVGSVVFEECTITSGADVFGRGADVVDSEVLFVGVT